MTSYNDYYIVGDDIDIDKKNEEIIRQASVRYDSSIKTSNRDDIEETNIKPAVAYEKFANINLTDQNLMPATKTSNDFKETMFDRMNRLKLELNELQEDVNIIIEKKKEANNNNNHDYESKTLEEIQKIQEDILQLAKEQGFKDITGTNDNESLSLESNLALLKSRIQDGSGDTILSKIKSLKESNANKDINFKVYIDKKTTSLKNAMKIDDIQGRIAIIEKLLGNTKNNNLLDQLEKMQKTLDFINDSKLETVVKKVTGVNQELEALNNKKQSINYYDPNVKKLEKLYESFSKVQNVNEEIPIIIERLDCLKLIHEESAYITDRVIKLKDMQSAIAANLVDNKDLLNKVNENFKKNIETIEKNMEALENRINNLKK